LSFHVPENESAAYKAPANPSAESNTTSLRI
jgi:hypothetical protein